MVFLTRLDGSELVINAEHLLTVERTPDTVVTLTTGVHLMVKENVQQIVEQVIAFKRQCAAGPRVVDSSPAAPDASAAEPKG
ncbi:MAG: flagellar FlbD family protein [Deltaproteobacteria bacterium]|nr:flagellar FlbD family protein [Deltaproteobacteria bacterium]